MSSTSIPALAEIPSEQYLALKQVVHDEIEPIIRKDLTDKNTVELAKFKDELRQQYETNFIAEIKKFEEEERKRRTPLTNDEIKKLLTKEYVKFKVVVQDEDEKEHTFTLRELPQSVEIELYEGARNIVTDLVTNYNAISFKVVDADLFQNILSLMDLFEPVQKFLTKCCVLCLDPPRGDPPKKKFDFLTESWVSHNLSNYRITAILMAQVEVSKMRDFFSILFQGFQNAGMKG